MGRARPGMVGSGAALRFLASKPMRPAELARGLADAFLGGAWAQAALLARANVALGETAAPAWLQVLVAQVVARWPAAPRDRIDELARFVAAGLPRVLARHRPEREPRIVRWRAPEPAMGP